MLFAGSWVGLGVLGTHSSRRNAASCVRPSRRAGTSPADAGTAQSARGSSALALNVTEIKEVLLTVHRSPHVLPPCELLCVSAACSFGMGRFTARSPGPGWT